MPKRARGSWPKYSAALASNFLAIHAARISSSSGVFAAKRGSVRRKCRKAGKSPLKPVSRMAASICSCSLATSARPNAWIAAGSMSSVVNSRIFAR